MATLSLIFSISKIVKEIAWSDHNLYECLDSNCNFIPDSSYMKKKKFYINKGQKTPKHIAFPDGGAVIQFADGSIAIIESQAPYGINNLFYKFDDFIIALN